MSEAWFGAIPSHWKVVKLGDIAEFINGRAFKPSEWGDTGKPIIRIQNLSNTEANINRYDGYIEDRFKVTNGDLLFAWSATIDVFKYTGEDAVLNQHIFKVKCSRYIDKDYMYAILKSSIPYMLDKTHGIGMKHLTKNTVCEFYIPLPPLDEQKQIVEYLYGKDTKVQLTEAQKIIADQLKHKQSIISEYVTGKKSPSGITYDSYKDSGIDWIGEIPSDWEVVKLGDTVDKIITGDWGSEQGILDKNLVCIRVADFDYPHLSIKDKEYTIGSYDSYKIAKKLLKNGDILLENSGGGEKSPVGKAVLWDKDIEATCANFIKIIRTRSNVHPKYMVYMLRVMYVLKITMNYFKQTTGIQNFHFKDMADTESIPLPPLSIQQAIVAELDAVVGEADAVIANAEKLINELKAYKTAVVFECVTKGLDKTVQTKDISVGGIV